MRNIINIPYETMGLDRVARLKQYLASFLRHNTMRKLMNFLHVEFQILRQSDRVGGMPYILKVESTNICNYHCPVCYENRKKHDFEGARGYGRMKADDFRKIVDELSSWLYRINLYGFGEPFLFDEIFDMVRYASDHNVGVAITSNFSTVDQNKIDQILDSGLEHLVISIDGVDQTSYEKYQVGGDYENVFRNIRMLIQTKKERKSRYPFVAWQFLITKHNHHLQKKAVEIAKNLGIEIRFSRIGVDLTNEKERSEWLPENPIRERLRFEDSMIKKQKGTPLCTWLYRTAFVNWDLGVSPCCNYYTGEKNHDFGNLKEKAFSDIWQGKRYAAARRIFKDRSTNLDGDNICHRCIVKREDLRKILQQQHDGCRDPKTCS